jgi:hypothetical protein
MNYEQEIKEVEEALKEWEINGALEYEAVPYLENLLSTTKKMQEEYKEMLELLIDVGECVPIGNKPFLEDMLKNHNRARDFIIKISEEST